MTKTQEIKKHWIPVYATQDFNNLEIGELPYSDIKTLLKRNLRVNLYLLTNDSRKQNGEICFKVVSTDEKRADTEFLSYRISNSYIKKIIRKGKNKVDDSFLCETKDNVKLKVKPFFMTKNKTKQNVLSKLRMNTRRLFSEYSKNSDFSRVLKDVVSGYMQKEIRQELKKIYPLALFEIRQLIKIK